MLVSTIFTYCVFVIVVNNVNLFNSTGTMLVAFNSPILYLNLILIVGANFLIDFTTYSGHMMFVSCLSHTVVEFLKKYGSVDKELPLPREIVNYIKLYNNNVIESMVSRVEGKTLRKNKTKIEKRENNKLENSMNNSKKNILNKSKSFSQYNKNSCLGEEKEQKTDVNRSKTRQQIHKNNLVSFQ